jgi:hypothetical protein
MITVGRHRHKASEAPMEKHEIDPTQLALVNALAG